MQGLHLTADLRGCASTRPAMVELEALRAICLRAVDACGLHAVGELFHRYVPSPDAKEGPSGVTGVVLLAESHLAVHTWPELGAATIDVYVCNLGTDNSARAESLMQALVAAFAPEHVEHHSQRRG